MAGLEIHSPEGTIGNAPLELAKLPGELHGVRLVALDNGKPGASSLLTKVGELLSDRVGFDFQGVVSKGSAATPCEEERLLEIIDSSELVITAVAD